MRSRLFRQAGSIIGLLAILITTLAPTVSQALAAHARFNALLSANCSASAVSRAPSGKSADSHRGGIGHWETCGYCNLAAHVPVMPLPLAMKPASPARQPSPLIRSANLVAPYAPVFAAHPRAPPALA